MIHALIDGDWILYAAGFAGQKNELVVDRGGKFFGPYKTMTEARKDLDTEDLKIYSRFVLDEDSHFFHSAKNMIESQCKKIAEKFGAEVMPHVYIDGDGNFRSKLATIKPYKGQRSVHAKPLKYNDIRQYMLDHWSAIVVHDQETDDQIAISQTALAKQGERSIIVSVDKDFLQVPGWHMNPNKGFKNVGEAEALKRLYIQCLTGDTVDNIGGCYKVGPLGARILLAGLTDERAMWDTVVAAYNLSGDHYNGLTGEEAALENMRLVYLRRTEDEIWTPS